MCARFDIPEDEKPTRSLPSVDLVVRSMGDAAGVSRDVIVSMVRDHLATLRADGRSATVDEVGREIANRISALSMPRLLGVINGTGVILHTNLGRAPVSDETAAAMAEASASYVPLEIDSATNARGGRMREISELLHLLAGAEQTLVVNNNAGALLLTLSALAGGREVIVSRGESVEIGGGFRVPDVVAQGGCRLVDVGTTNKTRAADFEGAVSGQTGALLKIHPSNFVVDGFTAEATISELAQLGRTHRVPLIHDVGSGCLIDPTRFGLRAEPTFQSSLADGADIVTASGDKLLGGPQAGIICGRAGLVDLIARHPLARALRADKATLAGVAATLRHYLAGEAIERVPVWRMISASRDALRERALAISASTGWEAVELLSTIGGGSLPGEELPSMGLAIGGSVDDIAASLRRGSPGVFGRISADRLLIDLRTVDAGRDDALTAALVSATASASG